MNKKISLASLVILIIAAIDNVRNLPAAALSGSSLIFFFFFSALVFLIPTSLVAAELSAAFPENGGVYHWVRKAFGKKMAMAAIWLQWVNTMVWYPSMLSFIAGTLAYLIDPQLVENKGYLIGCILVIFWGLTLINLKGIHVSALINTICCAIGTMIPLGLLIGLGAIWIFSGQPLQIEITSENIIPPLANTTSWVSLIAIMASFLGIELSGVHVNDIENPQKNFPKAVMIACSFIFLTMMFGSLAIAFVMPEKEISLISGVMQLFESFFSAFGLTAFMPVLTLLIVVGCLGMMINWLISPAKGLLHAAEFGFLPKFFQYKNKAGVASRILIGQGVVVSAFCLVFFLEPNINGNYWFLTALSTELYMMMYVLMFLSGLKLHYDHKLRDNAFKIPGKTMGIWSVSLLGMIGCLMTILVSFFPPDNIALESPTRYVIMIIAGNIIALSPLAFFFAYQKRTESALATA